MPIEGYYTDLLTLVPPVDTPDGQGGYTRSTAAANAGAMQVYGLVEARGGQGRRLVTDAGDIIISTHQALLPPYLRQPDGQLGEAIAGVLTADWHVIGPDATDYIVVAPPRPAKRLHSRDIHHLEVDLQVVGGGI